MWKYNETNNLPGNSLYHSANELYHHGVLGMKWGHRKNKSLVIRNNKQIDKEWLIHKKMTDISELKIKKMSQKGFEKYMDTLTNHQDKLKNAELSRTSKKNRQFINDLMEHEFAKELTNAMLKRYGY